MDANGKEAGMEVEHLEDHFQLDAEEVYQEMLAKEKRAERVQFNEDYLSYRHTLVEWMTQIGESILSLAAITIHLAVAYLDKAVSRQEVHPSRLQLVAVACILAAAKHEEMESKAPSVPDLNYCCKNIYTAQIICKMEVLLLNILNWELMLLTPRHFLQTFFGRGASSIYPDDLIGNDQVSFDKHLLVQRYLRKYAEFFTDLCLQDHNFSSYLPSIVASSAIASARRQLKLTPVWPKRLRKLTGYSKVDITPCLEHMWNAYQLNFVET